MAAAAAKKGLEKRPQMLAIGILGLDQIVGRRQQIVRITFFGYPGVSALDIHGHQVGLPATHSGAKQTVTLAPGATAHVVLEVTDASQLCAHPVKAAVLRVFPPGQFHAQLVGFPSSGCPGTSVMHVDAMHPRAGIPGFSSN
jgi:hypothetical protein